MKTASTSENNVGEDGPPMYMYAYMYVCMYIYTHICMYACIYILMYETRLNIREEHGRRWPTNVRRSRREQKGARPRAAYLLLDPLGKRAGAGGEGSEGFKIIAENLCPPFGGA